jgi:ankyrin repeat protein
MAVSRRQLIQGGVLMATATAVGGRLAAQGASASTTPTSTAIPDRGPRLDPDMVREFVIAGHGKLDRTRELLEQQPALINATWDWGGGDWETALGGASHMGNKPIAEFLLAHGARMDVFCATMMGKIEIVKAFLADDPTVIDLKGPHGIPLIRHAKAGQQDAIMEMLIAKGAKI